jgi:hypothetical protein
MRAIQLSLTASGFASIFIALALTGALLAAAVCTQLSERTAPVAIVQG